MKGNIFHTIENGLIYIGYVVGFVLFLENISKIFRGTGKTGINIIFITFLLWFISFLSRRLFSTSTPLGLIKKVKLEFLYFLFCHMFVAMFATTLLQHIPISLNPVGYKYISYKNYSEFLNYFTENLIFFLIVNGVFVLIFLSFLLVSTKFLYKFFLYQSDSLIADASKTTVLKILTYGSMLVITLIFLQIPFVSTTYGVVSNEINAFLQRNFQWLVDYFLGSPVFYYAYASFKGSKLAEEFSLYRKFI